MLVPLPITQPTLLSNWTRTFQKLHNWLNWLCLLFWWVVSFWWIWSWPLTLVSCTCVKRLPACQKRAPRRMFLTASWTAKFKQIAFFLFVCIFLSWFVGKCLQTYDEQQRLQHLLACKNAATSLCTSQLQVMSCLKNVAKKYENN